MAKEMLINVAEGEECRIALVEDSKLEELYMERTSSTSHVGNIYKGKVTNVEPSIQAAFVDFGLGRNGFLHISDLMPTYFGRRGEDVQESVGRKMARRDRPPIQRCLRRGDEIVVQIIKEGIGTKGPTLSTYLSIPGRILVMMPGMSKLGVSRKIEDEVERRRLRQILDTLKPPKDFGFIIRTAGVGRTKADIQRDLSYLLRLWQNIDKVRKSKPAPVELYTEGDLVTRTVRDVFTSDVQQIVVDNDEVAERVREFLKIAMPRTKNKVELYDGPLPLFHRHGLEKEIEQMYSRHVPLPSGGSLVIDSTEAIVAIDVNSGKFREHADAELTAFKTDMEAADEIPRQLRLRDLGGVIICDFIDLRYERHRRELEKKLIDNLKRDRAKTRMLRMSEFGIIEMTRQRMRPSLKRSIYFDCPHCKGAGLVKTPESMSIDVMRRLAIAVHDARVHRVEVAVAPDVAFYLQNRKRQAIAELEDETQKRIIVRTDASLGLDELRMDLYDQRDGLVVLPDISTAVITQPYATQLDTHPRHAPRRGEAKPRMPQKTHARPQEPEHEPEAMEDRFDLDRFEEAVEQREEQLMEEMTVPPSPEAPEVPQAHGPAVGSEARPTGKRRRRRRRRGRGGQKAEQLPQPSDVEAEILADRIITHELEPGESPPQSPSPEAAVQPIEAERKQAAPPPEAEPQQEPEAEEPEKKSRRRRRRGGARSKRAADKVEPVLQPQGAAVGSAPSPAPPLTKTGSTDRHLIEDEPIVPEPVRRPRTYRDLDHIPDEFD